MSNIPGGGAPPSAPSSGGTTGTPSAAIGTLRGDAPPPALLQQLSGGATSSATVVRPPAGTPNPQGQLTLQTPTGTVTVQTGLNLPPGTQVSLTLQSTGPPVRLLIQPQAQQQLPPLPGQPAPSGGAFGRVSGAAGGASAATGATVGGGTVAGAPAFVTSLTVGQTLLATVVTPAANQSAALGNAAQSGVPQNPSPTAQSSGAQSSGVQSSGNAAAQSSGQQATPVASGVSSATLSLASQTAANLPNQPALPAGSHLPIRIAGLSLPGQPAPSLPSGGFLGTVTGHTTSGQTTVATPHGTLGLDIRSPLPPGTQLALSLAGAPQPASATPLAGLQGAGEQWAALHSALGLLQQADPAAAQRAAQALPQVNSANLGAAALLFISAVRGGGFERWLGGGTARAVDRAVGRGTTSRLDAEMTSSLGRARDGGGGEWRFFSIPLMGQDEIERLRLYLRDRGDKDRQEEESRKSARRFVIEANFTKLGPFQFDGLVRERHIDLGIRTLSTLQSEARDDIRGLFANTVSALGYSGTVEFQVVRKFDIVPVEETGTANAGIIV